jgi:F-type H+-transporting ATPase subunit delta
MQEGPVGRRYARALILALEGAAQDTLTKVEEELSALGALLDRRTGHAHFRQAMLNPGFSAEQRTKVLMEIAESNKLEAITRTFLKLLVEKDRIPQLASIAAAFRDEVDQKVGRVRATIVTAKALDAAALTDIVRGLEKRTGKKVVPEVEVDPSVIAGVQAKIGGLVFDATVRSQLERLKNDFQIQ